MDVLKAIDWDKVWRVSAHALLMLGAIYIGQHPEMAMYAPVLQYIGNNISSPKA